MKEDERAAATPADRVVALLGQGKPQRVADLLTARLGRSVDVLRVYRWRYPRRANGGGTGGLVPAEFHRPLLDVAAELGADFDAWDLVPGPPPRCQGRARA